MTAVIESVKVCAGYGTVPVTRDVDLEVRAGQVVAVLGANGAGKTTTLRSLVGVIAPSSGEVRWNGQATRAPLHRRASRGLAYVSENRSIAPTLTVRENLRIGRGNTESALERFPELRPLLRRRASLLSGGEQQILSVAVAL
jgi:branched-chain amino acid transport system ATP-binding protein